MFIIELAIVEQIKVVITVVADIWGTLKFCSFEIDRRSLNYVANYLISSVKFGYRVPPREKF